MLANIKLVAITGPARSGKDTLARALAGQFGYRQYSFAEPIYKMLNTLPYLEHVHSGSSTQEKEMVNSFYGQSVRRMLQTLGTEWGRDLINPDIWVRLMDDKLQRKYDITKHGAFVISDLRFENEAKWVRDNGGLVVRMKRPDGVVVSAHSSENGILMTEQDWTVVNDGTIEDLCKKAPQVDEFADRARDAYMKQLLS